VFVATLKYAGSLRPARLDPAEPNDPWSASRKALAAGMRADARIALVGSPFDAYWARVNRSKIVAVVQPRSMPDYNALTSDARRRLFAEFRKAGADYIVVQMVDPPAGADRTWAPVQFVGWVWTLQ
jgi:hypothetical protein